MACFIAPSTRPVKRAGAKIPLLPAGQTGPEGGRRETIVSRRHNS